MDMGIITCKGKYSRIQHNIYAKIVNSKLLQWYSEKINIPEYIIADNVNWRSFNLARKKGRLNLTTFITKWPSCDTSTSRVMVQRKTNKFQLPQIQ